MAASVVLSSRQRRALEAICDRFAPGGSGMPSASAIGVPDALIGAVAERLAQPGLGRDRLCRAARS
jgi:hypothetical protein